MEKSSFLEKEIQKQILEYLKIKRVFHFRNNTGAGKLQGGRFVRFGIPGAPDIFAVKNGILWGLEVKRAAAKLSPLQEEFGAKMIDAGAKYIVLRSLDDCMAIF